MLIFYIFIQLYLIILSSKFFLFIILSYQYFD